MHWLKLWWCGLPGEIIQQLGNVCSLEVPLRNNMLPPPTTRATMLEVAAASCTCFYIQVLLSLHIGGTACSNRGPLLHPCNSWMHGYYSHMTFIVLGADGAAH